jgi:phosphoglycolate phosphatase-like HAD superfamily hydrolase
MFDLDGTLVDSNAIDSQCYLQALLDVFGFDIDKIDRNWGNYPHITDAGILQTLCQTELGRDPTHVELCAYQQRFLELLTIAVSLQPLQSIAGAGEILAKLNEDPRYAIAIATGAWKQTAQFKLQQVSLDAISIPMACSDDARARVDIMQCAYDRTLAFYRRSQFQTVTYIGDGVWDGIASKQLNYHFIGIGTGERIADLFATGAKCVFPNYQNLTEIMSAIFG